MTDHRFGNASLFDVDFWKQLAPSLTINQDLTLRGTYPAAVVGERRVADINVCRQLLNEDGYFVYQSWFAADPIDRLAGCVDRLETLGLPPVFCFVYDQAWQLLLDLEPLLRELLGEYLLLPDVWAWHVKSDRPTAFPPHRDQVRDCSVDDDDHLDYLTVWIPLVDLNHLTSSICIVPASADPDYDAGTDRVRVEDLQQIRSLQGPRGSVFGWTTGLIHWGTQQSRQGEPRKSIGLFVQKPSAERLGYQPLDFSQPFLLERRLAIIGQQILTYSGFENDPLLDWARRTVQVTR